MRETPNARAAWNDYLEMGDGRSLPKLAERYKSGIGVPTRQLSRLLLWSATFNWQQRLAKIAETERQAIVAKGIAAKQNRVDALNDRWQRMQQVIDERAEDNADLTGGRTGLIVREVTYLPSGGERVKHEVDTGLLAEMRATEKQAAQELGEWTEKREVTGADGGPIEIVDARERLASRIASIAARTGAPSDTSESDATGSGGAA